MQIVHCLSNLTDHTFLMEPISLQYTNFSDNTYNAYLKCCCWLNCVQYCNKNLIQNSQAVKKECGPQKGYGEKRCEIQGGGQEMAVMVG